MNLLFNILQTGGEVVQAGVFEHVAISEIVAGFAGILFIWALKYSKEKDKFDAEKKAFSIKGWLTEWFKRRNDNIFIHVLFTLIAIWLGQDNLQAWLGDTLTIPDQVDKLGSSFIIGFSGTFVVELLKKPL